jgi:hypothetical protein
VQPVDRELAGFPRWDVSNIPEARGSDLNDLWMNVDGTEGWAVGSAGKILHYTDGRWHADTVPAVAPVLWTSIAFTENADMGLAVGNHGWVARYAGGHRWTTGQEGAANDSLTSIWLDDSGSEAFAVGKAGAVLHWKEGRWSRLSLPGISTATMLDDVVGNDEQIWVRAQARVSVFSRAELRWVRNIGNFDASDLWTQPPSQQIWIAGVSLPGGGHPRDTSYTIRRYDSGNDSIKLKHLLPLTSWIGNDDKCALVAGPDEKSGTPLGFSGYLAAGGTYLFRNPASIHFSAVWVNPSCSYGWAVGPDGFVGRLRRQPLTLNEIREELGSPADLTARYVLVLDSGVPRPDLDRMRMLLLQGEETIALRPKKHFDVDTLNAYQFRLQMNAGARTETTRIEGQEVKLRLELPYALSDPRYPVLYERSGSFVFAKKPLWVRYPYLSGVLVLILVVLGVLAAAARWAPVRRFIFSSTAKDVLEGSRGAYVAKVLKGSIMFVPPFRRWLFSRYREQLRYKLQQATAGPPPEVEIVQCHTWNLPTAGGGPSATWRTSFEAALKHPKGVLWVEDPSPPSGDNLLRGWATLALEHGKIPVLINLTRTSPIYEQIRVEWDRLGEIPEGMPDLWTAGGFVFLLLGSGELKDPAATEQFTYKEGARNLVVVCRSSTPSGDYDCHVRTRPSAPSPAPGTP